MLCRVCLKFDCFFVCFFFFVMLCVSCLFAPLCLFELVVMLMPVSLFGYLFMIVCVCVIVWLVVVCLLLVFLLWLVLCCVR